MRANDGRIKVSGFKNVKNTTPVGDFFIDDILDGIRDGKWREKVERVRCLKDKPAYDKAKTTLPCISPSGIFSQKNNKNLVKHSGLICIDVDNIENVEEVKDKIKKAPFIYSAFVSASGNGLAIIVRIEPEKEKHLLAFEELKEYFSIRYGIGVDKGCSDISRLRFLSYDPELYHNPNAKIFNVSLVHEEKAKIPIQSRDGVVDTAVFKQVEDIVKQVVKGGVILGDDSYQDWLKIGFAFASTFKEAGRGFYHEISSTSTKYDQETCDKQYTKCLNSNGKNFGEDITIRSFFLFAKEARLEITLPDKREKCDVLSYLESWSDIQKMDITVEWVVDRLIPKDGITLVFGKGGIGKTWLLLHIAQHIGSGTPFLGFKTSKAPVIFIDFENPLAVLNTRTQTLGDAEDVFFWRVNNEKMKAPKLDSKEWEQYKGLPEGAVLIFDTLRASQSKDENASDIYRDRHSFI